MRYTKSILLFTVFLVLLLSCDESSVTNSGSDSNNDNNENTAFSYNHENAPGSSASDFLREEDFGNLVVEIDYMEGYEPTSEALNSLQEFLESRLHKSNVTILSPSSITARGQSNYTASEVRDLEEANRNEYSEENTLAAYILILDGEYEQSNVLGIAYYNTSTALFGESIQNVSNGVGANPRDIIEATVLRHEFGHLLGLVDNGIEMVQEHKDEQHGDHCNNENCLMYYSVRTTDFFSVLLGGDVPELDDQCLNDLEAAGGK